MINVERLENKKTEALPCSVSLKTKKQVNNHVNESNFSTVSEYLRHLIQQDIQDLEIKEVES